MANGMSTFGAGFQGVHSTASKVPRREESWYDMNYRNTWISAQHGRVGVAMSWSNKHYSLLDITPVRVQETDTSSAKTSPPFPHFALDAGHLSSRVHSFPKPVDVSDSDNTQLRELWEKLFECSPAFRIRTRDGEDL
ncbi:hypothetical protein LshimejAT787_0300620 [Lyophyllum shimeji]|uniref:Uncharacterized protein n=1 Tax=Lyophyllum shimeji TaxID=47721 RepID=A0A9P3PHY9_LYOSH|nr:hypothetical protein LshimejAT787_0300620 [Lyophyllum shimeji]